MATAPSLFGAPEDIQQQRNAALNAEAAQYAQMDPFQQATFGIYKGANQLGGAIGGMLGGQDPQLQKATALKQLASQFDTTTPQGMGEYARALNQAGFNQEAMQASQVAQEGLQRTALLSKTNAEALKAGREKAGADPIQQLLRSGKFATANVAKYEQTGNIADLGEPLEKLSQPEIQKLQTYRDTLPAGSQARAEVDKVIAAEGKGKGTTITNVLPGVKAAGDVVGLREGIQKITKPYQDNIDSAGDAIGLADMAMATNNFAAVSTLSRSLAKASGETQLSKNDVAAYGIDPSLIGSVSDTISRLTKGRPTIDTLKQLKQLAVAIKAKNEERLGIEEGQLRDTARVSELFTPQQIETVFRRRPTTGGTSFTSLEAAEAAKLPRGTQITINGRRAIVE